MKVLAIDSSTMITSCSLLEGDIIIGDFSINQEKTHSEALIPMIRTMLEYLDLSITDVNCFAVAIGPGSFTGLRIGITTAKTLAQVFDKPIVGISTLEAMARGVYHEGIIVPILDARGGRVYFAVYQQRKGKWSLVIKPDLIQMDELIDMCQTFDTDIVFTGDTVFQYRQEISTLRGAGWTDSGLNNCLARNIAVLAKEKYIAGNTESYFHLAPEYLRKSQAQRDLELKEKQKNDNQNKTDGNV